MSVELENYATPVMVDISIGNVCLVIHNDEYKVFNVFLEEGWPSCRSPSQSLSSGVEVRTTLLVEASKIERNNTRRIQALRIFSSKIEEKVDAISGGCC